MIHFSVVIPTLNSPTLARTLAALERQTVDRAQVEVIVAGMDERLQSGEWGMFYPTEHPLFPGAARNQGAAHASGEVIVFTDSDCLPEPNWLAVLAGRFGDPAVTVVGGGVAFKAENFWTLADNIGMFHEYLTSLPPGQREQLPSLNLAIRRRVFLDIGGFDENRRTGEDSDLTIRLRRQGHVLHFEPQAVVVHAPPRDRAADLFRHNFLHGQYSVKFDPRYGDEQGLHQLLRTRWGVALSSPLLAAGVTVRMFLSDRSLWRYWYTAPAIFLAKLVWCFGAAARPNERIWNQSV